MAKKRFNIRVVFCDILSRCCIGGASEVDGVYVKESCCYKIITGGLGGNSLSVDKEGNAYYAIDYSAEITFGDLHLKGGNGGLLVIKCDPEGKILWHILTPSSNTGVYGYTYPTTLLTDNHNGVFIAGSITGTLRFGNSLVQASSNTYSELLVAKLDQSGVTTGIKTIKGEVQTTMLIRPNPSGNRFLITFPEDQITLLYSVTDITGRIIINTAAPASSTHRELLVDLSSQPKGIYFLSVHTQQGQQVKKLIKN